MLPLLLHDFVAHVALSHTKKQKTPPTNFRSSCLKSTTVWHTHTRSKLKQNRKNTNKTRRSHGLFLGASGKRKVRRRHKINVADDCECGFSHICGEFFSDAIVYIGINVVERAIDPSLMNGVTKLSSATPVSSIEW